jgi:ParB/RepB/Spo0J family partition protein
MDAIEKREELGIRELDQRYGSLRLASPQEMGRLRESIERMGILSPVVVATAVEPEHLVLVDGFKRVRILRDRGEPSIWAMRSPLDAQAAKVAMVAANAPHKGLCDLEEGWIVRSLCREHKMLQVDVGKSLRRDKSWVSRRLALVERLEEELQNDIRLGLLSSTVARELSRLPRGNQLRMASTIRAHGLTSKQAHRLVTALLDTDDPQARDELLADPLRYLGAASPVSGPPTDPRLGPGENDLRRSLLAVDVAGERLVRSVRRNAPAGLAGEEARILAPLVSRALRVSGEMSAVLGRLCEDTGQ